MATDLLFFVNDLFFLLLHSSRLCLLLSPRNLNPSPFRQCRSLPCHQPPLSGSRTSNRRPLHRSRPPPLLVPQHLESLSKRSARCRSSRTHLYVVSVINYLLSPVHPRSEACMHSRHQVLRKLLHSLHSTHPLRCRKTHLRRFLASPVAPQLPIPPLPRRMALVVGQVSWLDLPVLLALRRVDRRRASAMIQ